MAMAPSRIFRPLASRRICDQLDCEDYAELDQLYCSKHLIGVDDQGRVTNGNRETVNHPDHYKSGGMEVIDVIEAFGLGFNLGNAVKYILRAGKKGDTIEDLRKAAWYLEREIANHRKDPA